MVELFARLPLILERVRNDYVEPVDERKLLGGATQGMLKAEPPAATISSADRRGGLGAISLDTIYDTALDILNGRKTDSNDAQLVDAAIKGLLDELDQHAIYMDEKNMRRKPAGDRRTRHRNYVGERCDQGCARRLISRRLRMPAFVQATLLRKLTGSRFRA